MSDVVGRTRPLVFTTALLTGLLGAGVMLTGVATGAVSTSFAISGTAYRATADEMTASGVVQYGNVEHGDQHSKPVLVNGFRDAKLANFCQSITADMPGFGPLTVRIAAPAMNATDLVIGLDDATGDMTMTGVEMGVDAGAVDKGPAGAHGQPGAFAAQADTLTFTGLKQQAWTTTAATMRLDQVSITATPGTDRACY